MSFLEEKHYLYKVHHDDFSSVSKAAYSNICGVEDEIHFLLKCSVLENIRKTTLSMIYKLYPNTENLDDKDEFIWLMTTEDPDMLHLLQQMLSSDVRISKVYS